MGYVLCIRQTNGDIERINLLNEKPSGVYDMTPRYLELNITFANHKDWDRYKGNLFTLPIKYLAVKIKGKAYYAALWRVNEGEAHCYDKTNGSTTKFPLPVPSPLTHYAWMDAKSKNQVERWRRSILYYFWRGYQDFLAEYVSSLKVKVGGKTYSLLKG